ncbi:hypothetical protein NLG97_g8071 [Lecanicillium saksenae]|uniref:Uncharacterized protein n=1 Tax=Lecanicillium saksenae TaxID=468837 RepID=A0ACC1QK13_9HYPO|nr:hypothetical protein NLG97_g8071 [Lecanicillium saksenae]
MADGGFSQRLWQNRNEGKFVDFKLQCDGHTFDVHKHSPIFLSGFTSESAAKEAGVYEIKEASPIFVFKMVEYMYTGTYAAPTGNLEVGKESCPAPVFHAKMMLLADTYMVTALYDEAKRQFDVSINSDGELLTLVRATPEIYNVAADIRMYLVGGLLKCIAQQLKETTPDAALYAALDAVGREVLGFSRDLLKLVITKDHWQLSLGFLG